MQNKMENNVSLLTPSLKAKLRKAPEDSMKPLVKIFNPQGAGTWLLCSLMPDDDTLWGYADLGMGCVEFGTISLSELQSVTGRLGLPLERDLYFDGTPEEDYEPEKLLNKQRL